MKRRKIILFISTIAFFIASCKNEKTRFELMPSSFTGILFNNQIIENDSLNVLNFDYLFNGAGVGIGDFNNDGLPDIFFSGNQVPGKLYVNKGGFKFEDITEKSGIKTPYWNTGVSIVDINQDGLPDIYVCSINPDKNKTSPNQLFINRGVNENKIPVFEEAAKEVGLASGTYSTQAVFFDYDNDGDPDCYLLNNALENFDRSQPLGQRKDGTGKSTDKLFRNEGVQQNGLPLYKDVSKEAGITIEGWGLGIGIADFNDDGWMDIYCANDFQSNDLLWMNNKDGTFTNRIAECLQHQSANSMGMDIADINNDGLPDIVNLDMLPEDNLRQKTMFSKPAYDRYQLNLSKGYQPQFVRNSLQLNRGMDKNGNPLFSEIGYLAGMYATDWSWSALLADFDNDGYKDLFVTNGYKKDVTNLDFAAYNSQNRYLSGNQVETPQQRLKRMGELLGVKKSDRMFRNRGDDTANNAGNGFSFEDVTQKWGLKIPSFSSGAAYADFDNDGDLDIVVNNMNDEAMVYKNHSADKKAGSDGNNNYLKIKLKGEKGNMEGVGAKITVYNKGQIQFLQQSPCRGYKSSVYPVLHFGLGKTKSIDSIQVIWMNGKKQIIKNIASDQMIQLDEKNSLYPPDRKGRVEEPVFKEVAARYNLLYQHQENDFNDFNFQFLIPHKYSQSGPQIATGDLNGDGLEDCILGGSAHNPATVFYQQKSGIFKRSGFLAKKQEDAGILIFDADNDGDNDVYCASGSSEFGKNEKMYQHRFYRNAGKGDFKLDTSTLPVLTASSSVVTAKDYDKDGDLDLFVGGRVMPLNYPMPPRSYLLQNDGKGNFTDLTSKLAPQLISPGMVTSAIWSDFDNDGWTDLIVAGEFMPVTFFKNSKGKFLVHPTVLSNAVGWFSSLAAADFDGDGDIDYVAGNLGLNSIYKASATEPVCLYAKDFNNDGYIDPVMCRYIEGKEYPAHFRESMIEQMIGMRRILNSYEDYGKMTFQDLFKPAVLKNAYILRATEFRTLYIENLGRGNFSFKPMPIEVQFAPVNAIKATDINKDGKTDIIMTGNDFSPETLSGRYDASFGNILMGNGNGGFASISLAKSGFVVKGDAKAMATISLKNGDELLLIARNRDSLKVLSTNKLKN